MTTERPDLTTDPRVGSLPDADLARELGVSRDSVRRARLARGIPVYGPVDERIRRRLICAVAATGRTWSDVARAMEIQLSQLTRKLTPPDPGGHGNRALYPNDVEAIAKAAGITAADVYATEAEPGDERVLAELLAAEGRTLAWGDLVTRHGADACARMIALRLVTVVDGALVLGSEGQRAARE
jgi:hypothetical protein